MYELSEARNDARERIKQAQERQRQRHDQTLQAHTFALFDLVLLWGTTAAQRQRGKLAYKWLRPYRIQAVLGKGVYRLAQLDGKTHDKPINAKRLKLYHQRAVMEPQVIIQDPAPNLALCADPGRLYEQH